MSLFTVSLPYLDHSSGFSSSPGSSLAASMQQPTNSATGSSMATGLTPPAGHSHSSLNMQSTTPSTANDKDEMRGWLYKWTNVNRFSIDPRQIRINLKPFFFFPLSSISKVTKSAGSSCTRACSPTTVHKTKWRTHAVAPSTSNQPISHPTTLAISSYLTGLRSSICERRTKGTNTVG